MKLKCRKIGPNSCLGIISLSSNCLSNQDRLEKFLKMLDDRGYRYKLSKTLYVSDGYLAGTDQLRAKELKNMFLDDEIDAVLCFKGGFGAIRILDLIDYQVIKDHPKLLVGYSDVTAVLNAIYQKTTLPTLHGNMGISLTRNDADQFSIDQFFDTLNGKTTLKRLENHKHIAKTLIGGNATGVLVGGNLSLISSLMGTEYEIDFKDKILLIEDIDEAPYRLDSMLCQLKISGKLNQLKGIIFGYFTNCEPRVELKDHQTWQSLIFHYTTDLKIPVIALYETGHDFPFINLPIGAKVSLDADLGSVIILESIFEDD